MYIKYKSYLRIISIVIISTVSVALATTGFTAETRGLKIVAIDKASGEKKEVKLYNKSYAVIIGIDQYQNLPFDRQLSYAVRDAKGVEAVLRKNFKFDKIITLYNKEATKDNILKVLMGDLGKELSEEDALFIFWAGHGNQERTREGDLGYLIPFDGSVSETYKNITMSQIRDDISKKIPAKHIFYVMDACYGGLLASTRSVDKEIRRDFNYLQEVTKERVRQVLTAGGKDQEVLDGGPKGHSVFTGRLIELLENTDDFITANEIQTIVKEKVFSDARARNHTQTPSYGTLYGVGDYVFVPSLERKVEDNQAKVADLQKELDALKATEVAALKAQDEQKRRQVEIDKLQVEARLKAEQLRLQNLEEEKSKREQQQAEDTRLQADLTRKKQEEEQRLAMLKKDVEQKRKELGSSAVVNLSPQKTLDEMQSIDRKINGIREQFRGELKNGILQIVNRLNQRHLKFADAKKDEFESEEEFKNRIIKEKESLDREQSGEFTVLQDRLEKEYNAQVAPFIEELKKLSSKEFTVTGENLILDLGAYDGSTNTYQVSIKAKKPLEILLSEAKTASKAQLVGTGQSAKKMVTTKGLVPAVVDNNTSPKSKYVMIAANAHIPIPRDEAREFKQHFTNNMLRPEIKGNFETPETFRVAQAYVIDDATTKKYDLFSSQLVDLGNGIIYDTTTKLLWSKDGNAEGNPGRDYQGWMKSRHKYVAYLNKTAYLGFRDWRLPNKMELESLVLYARQAGYGTKDRKISDFLQSVGFVRIERSYGTDTGYISTDYGSWNINMESGESRGVQYNYADHTYVLPVRGGISNQDSDQGEKVKKSDRGYGLPRPLGSTTIR